MDKNTVLYVIAALLLGFIGGFLLANSMNRSEVASLRAQALQSSSLGTAPPANANSNPTEPSLTDEEIKSKIAEAESNATNFQFQKDLGTALYKYASMKQLPNLLPDAMRILERADSLNSKDFEVLVALGNAHFDVGFQKKETAEFQKAREIYARALAIKPGDADVETDAAITWFVQSPPDYTKAATELEKVGTANPKHTRSMQFLAQTYIKMGRAADAQKVVEKIKSIDPTDDSIADLSKQLADAKAK